jgi:putative ABC transport system permease protein
MARLRGWFRRLRVLTRRGAAEREIDEEFRLHLEYETEKYLRAGMSPAEARREAVLAFGGVERYREEVREARGVPGLETLAQDARYALRTLRRDFGFAAVVVLTLAVGIGLNTAVFSVVRAVLLDPLPYREPDRLVMVWSEFRAQGIQDASSGYANVLELKAQARSFEDLATFDPISLTLAGGAWPEKISGVQASANFFSVLGVAPALGRAFSREEERGRAAVVVLSDGLWRRRFGGSPGVLGRTIEIGGAPFQVIGVMPPDFAFPDEGSQLWLPQTVFTDFAAARTGRGAGSWRVVGRLKPGVTLPAARRELSAIASRLEQADASANAGLDLDAVALRDQVTGTSFQLALWMLFGAVGLVLLIAFANGAHMILARGIDRSHEFGLRRALGASTGRLVRQALTESMLLTLCAGAAGVLMARAGLHLLVVLAPAGIPRLGEIRVDTAVLLYATAVSVVVGIAFGVAPALGLSRSPLYDVLREGGSPSRRRRGQSIRRLLIVFQFALAIVLVFGASLLVRSLVRANGVEPGFGTENVLMANLSVESPAGRVPFYDQVVRDVCAIPGVVSTGLVEDLFVGGAPSTPITIDGRGSVEPTVTSLRVDAIAGDFLRTMRVPLRAGRGFTLADGPDAPPVALVNETMARRFWPGESPLGRRFRLGADSSTPWIEVVGVVADMSRQGPEKAPFPQAFRPYGQAPSRNMVLLVRTDEPAPGLATAVRTRIAAIDRTVPLYSVTTVADALDRYLLQRRFQTVLLGLFSAIALLLAAIGVYGLIQYSVSQRTREIGVRIALGGTSGRMVAMILRQGLALAVPGLAAGMGCALLLSRALSSLFFGVAASDGASIVVTSAVLLLTTALACYLPARRAAKVDPMTALRRG